MEGVAAPVGAAEGEADKVVAAIAAAAEAVGMAEEEAAGIGSRQR